MSETTILDNLNKEANYSDNLWIQEDGNTGLGVQFRLFSAAVVSKVRVRLYREGWNGLVDQQDIFLLEFYGSHSNQFRDQNDYALGWWLKATTQLAAKKSQAMRRV